MKYRSAGVILYHKMNMPFGLGGDRDSDGIHDLPLQILENMKTIAVDRNYLLQIRTVSVVLKKQLLKSLLQL